MAIAPTINVWSHTTDTAWWEMARVEPPRDLSAHVVSYLGYAEHHAGVLRRREVPFAGIPVIMGFGSTPYEIETANSLTPRVVASAFLSGMNEGHSITSQRGLQQGLQLDLTPLGAYRLFGVPMRELTNQVVTLDEMLGRDGTRLVDQLASSAEWQARFDLLEHFLRTRLDEAPDVDPAVAWAWSQLERSAGAVRVADLADEIGWSRHHFARRFTAQVGLPPKATGRVLRFSRATEILRTMAGSAVDATAATSVATNDKQRVGGGIVTLADVAAACGYSDHSHFDREFRSLAGCTPSAYVSSFIPGDAGIVA